MPGRGAAALFAAAGAPAEMVEAIRSAPRRRAAEEPVEVLPEVVPTIECFLAVQTQWVHAGQAALPTGLDYARVEAAMRMAGVRRADQPRMFDGLRAMEAAALPILQDRVLCAIRGRARR